MSKQRELSLNEIAQLASVIVRDAHCEPRYSADDTALALIKLASAIAACGDEDDRTETVLYVTLGCFHRTDAHGKAIDAFTNKGRRFDVSQLPDKGRAVAEFWRREVKR
jgi:hypothetical protein